jgi:CubicO group peptidase (beta-lactamase class C family)
MTAQKLFNETVRILESTRDKNGELVRLSSIIISTTDDSFSHNFGAREAIDIRSVAKPIVCLAIGAAIEKGLYFNGIRIDLETRIWPFLKQCSNVVSEANQEKWKELTLMDCFRITLGHDKGLMFSADIKGQDENKLLDYILNYPITRRIGVDFVYSNAGTFLISVLISEFLGKNLAEFVNDFVFRPLGILEYSWKTFGKYCAGCTGLRLYNEDLHKVGLLLRDGGKYRGHQVVPGNWIERMRSVQVAPPTHRYIADRAFPKWAYGMNLWICEDGSYYCDGTEGQYLIVIPYRGVVITVVGNQPDTEPVSKVLGLWKQDQ